MSIAFILIGLFLCTMCRAFAIIRGATASAAITIGGAAWTDIIQSMRVRATLPQIDATTYSTEANGDFIAGIERLTIDLAGLMTKGRSNSGPLMPLVSYQGTTIVITYDTSCTVTATCNATDGDLNRPAGTMGLITAQFVSTGSFSVSWVLS